MDYTRLSLVDVRKMLDDVARETQSTFGDLGVAQLNWRSEATRWTVAQCFEHLVTANRLLLRAAKDALEKPPTTMWQRVPLLPGLMGRMLIRSQVPESARKFTAAKKAQPTTGEIPADIVQRFVEQQGDAVEWMRALDERDASRAIMISPFIKFVTYSVLDGCRLLVAHDRRHVEQARRVLLSPGFPAKVHLG